MDTSPISDAEKKILQGAPLTERTVAAAHRSIDALAKHAYRSEQTLREAASSSADKYVEQQEYVRGRVNNTLDRSRTYMREHPLAAAGMAFAAGMVLTALCGKRR